MKRWPLLVISAFFLILTILLLINGVVANMNRAKFESVFGSHDAQPFVGDAGVFQMFGASSAMMIILLVVWALMLAIWIGAILHLVQNPALSDTDKIVWALIVILLNVLGAILYMIAAPSPRSADTGRSVLYRRRT